MDKDRSVGITTVQVGLQTFPAVERCYSVLHSNHINYGASQPPAYAVLRHLA